MIEYFLGMFKGARTRRRDVSRGQCGYPVVERRSRREMLTGITHVSHMPAPEPTRDTLMFLVAPRMNSGTTRRYRRVTSGTDKRGHYGYDSGMYCVDSILIRFFRLERGHPWRATSIRSPSFQYLLQGVSEDMEVLRF